MASPFAGTNVHWTFVFFRLTLRRIFSRAPCMHGHLRALVTIPGEKCGLEAERTLDIKVYSALGSNEGRLPYADATHRCAVRVRRAGRLSNAQKKLAIEQHGVAANGQPRTPRRDVCC